MSTTGARSPAEEIAFAGLEAYLSGRALALPDIAPTGLDEPAGTFVTWFDDSGIRGSMGTGRPIQSSAAREIAFNAIQAGVNDPRYEPLVLDDLEYVSVAVDVLRTHKSAVVSDLERPAPPGVGVRVRQGRSLGIVLPWAGEQGGSLADLARDAMESVGIDQSRDFALELVTVEHYGGTPTVAETVEHSNAGGAAH